MRFSSSSEVAQSGTGSQMKSGFEASGFRVLRAARIERTREMQREGEQRRWKDLEKRRVGVRSEALRRRRGVRYL